MDKTNNLNYIIDEIMQKKCENLLEGKYEDNAAKVFNELFNNYDDDYFYYWLNKVGHQKARSWIEQNIDCEANSIRENPYQLIKLIDFLPEKEIKKNIINNIYDEIENINHWRKIFQAKNFNLNDYKVIKSDLDLELAGSIFSLREIRGIDIKKENRILLIKLLLNLDIFKKVFYGEHIETFDLTVSNDFYNSKKDLSLENNFLFGYIEFLDVLPDLVEQTNLNINHLNKNGENAINFLLKESVYISYFINIDQKMVINYYQKLIEMGVDVNQPDKDGFSFFDYLKKADELISKKKINLQTPIEEVESYYGKSIAAVFGFFSLLVDGNKTLQHLISLCEKQIINKKLNKSLLKTNNKL